MRRVLAAVTTAALLLAAAPPLDLTPLALLALAPLLTAARRTADLAAAAVLGWASGVVFYVGLVPWLPATIARLQGMHWWAVLALFFAYATVQALQFAMFAVAARSGRTPLSRIAAATASWVLIESAFPQLLPWSLGAALGPHPLLRQGADLAGPHGLAALLVATNAALAEAAVDWRARRARAGAALSCAALLIGAAGGYGLWRRTGEAPVAPERAWRIAVAQAGAPAAPGSGLAEEAAVTWDTYAALSAPRAGAADLVVWPEGVLRVYLRAAAPWQARAAALARQLRATLVIGALDRAADGVELSAAYVFSPALSAIAYKTILVPFGEYVPLPAPWLPLRWWQLPAPRRPGPQPVVVDVGVRAAPSLCFEAILPGQYNAAVRAGAEVLVNLSDDSWFDSDWAAAQHLEMTRLRTVETRRWLVRASHSGISAVIDAHGDVVAALPYATRGTLVQAVPRAVGVTPYARWGDAPLLSACSVVMAVVLGGNFYRWIVCRRTGGWAGGPRSCAQ